MSINKKTRFNVFKRDLFACLYCGRKPPEVMLQVDHIVPSSKGGPDHMDNLLTSCEDCNQGKSDRMLTDIPESLSIRHEKMAEQTEQLAEYNKFLLKQRRAKDRLIRSLGLYWFNQFMTEKDEYVFGPDRVRSMRTFIEKLPEAEIIDAIDKAIGRVRVNSTHDEKAWKYFCGICWMKIKHGS